MNETLVQNALILALLGYSVQLAARSGTLSLAGVGFYGIGGFVAGNLAQREWSASSAVLAAVLGAAVVGVVLSAVFTRVRGLYFAMGTLAFTLFMQTLASSWPTFTGGENGIFGIPILMTTTGLILMVGIVAVFAFSTERGSSGRKLQLMETDETLAGSLGVRIPRERTIALIASAACGAAAGAAQALSFGYFGPSQISFHLVTQVVIVMVIGGAGSWAGPIIGAFVLASLPTWLGFTGDWRPVILGLVAVVIVVVLPGGAVGTVGGMVRWGIIIVRPAKERVS